MEDKYKDYIELYHICLPIKARNSVSMDNGYWRPWNPDEKHLWVRELPKNSINIYITIILAIIIMKIRQTMTLTCLFPNGIQIKKSKTVCLIGIRSDESFSRYIRIRNNFRKYKNNNYIYELKNGSFNAYLLYDWTVKDIWIANAKFGLEYNQLYDPFYYAGVSIDKMRVASPFNDCASSALKLYKVIDPNMWGKMISRINSVSFTGMYGGTTAMGWKSIKKPKNFTWEQYLIFLLSTLDGRIRYNYESRFATSIKFWKEKCGVLDDKVIKKLEELGIDFKNKGKISKVSDKNSVVFETYPDDVEINAFKDVLSFKRMCICILKNDWYCKYMGFTPTKKEQSQKKAALEKYKNLQPIKNKKLKNEK